MAKDTVAEIKDRLSVQDVVGQYVKLRRAGRSLVGLCPFHKEKTGSFHVSPERGSYHCFGCGEGGDIFSFIEKVEGVDFKGAMQILADKAGVKIEYQGGRSEAERSKEERLRALMARAAQWYQQALPGSPGEAYAKKRGLTEASIAGWGLGYAPDDWRKLLEALTAEGYSVQEMLAAGLVKEADGKPGTYYDRFRNRLMFPIRDVAGRVVAFTGRALSGDDLAKYLNSPETELYHKSDVLYGMDRAKDAIRTRGFTLLVEGQMDVIHAHQAGFENAIALSGTALTDRHLSLMKRFSDNLMLVLDADPAGLKATSRSAILALQQGLRVKATRLPDGKDPADLISEDAKEFAARVKAAAPVADFFLAVLTERESDPHRLVRAAEDIVLPLIAAVPSPMEREHFMQNAGRILGLSTESVRESVVRAGKAAAAPISVSQKPGPPVAVARTAKETRGALLRAVMHAYAGTPLADRVKSEYLRITEASELPPDMPEESALFQAEQSFGEASKEAAADELLSAFEQAVIREAYQEAVVDLRRAEAAGDGAAVVRAQEVCAKLSARLALL